MEKIINIRIKNNDREQVRNKENKKVQKVDFKKMINKTNKSLSTAQENTEKFK